MSGSLRRSQPDEGYSEHPLTVVSQFKSEDLPLWLAEMSPEDRSEYILDIMRRLPTSEVWDIVGKLKPRLKMDFFFHLPSEICLRILSFLDPVSLIKTARTSRHWQTLAFDRKLWEQLYLQDGFRVIRSEVNRFEYPLGQPSLWMSSKNSLDSNRPVKRRLATNSQRMRSSMDGENGNQDSDMMKQTSIFGPASVKEMRQSPLVEDSIMIDAPILAADSDKSSSSFSSAEGGVSLGKGKGKGVSRSRQVPTLAVQDGNDGEEKLNWHYLYTQRRRLEANWEAGRYINFQLPHPLHPEEGHTECIYTIQHTQNYLVSGSRDKSIRIWNLDKRRLALPPLEEHQGSVLCLQFDPDPEEDIIISGSSDSTVIIWRFSTGKVVQRMTTAHRESVLNVKFDKRVLVTCSKDKTIKVFNRRPMNSGNIVNNSASIQIPNLGFQNNPSNGSMIMPYTCISTLIGHGAAVNAVQVLGDEVVSASGDRTVKIWNWTTSSCTRTLIGHSKGIACVQYDGRRIVSGSSDNEVKVFDRESGLEVASLRSHTNLVRTVQAGFGDLPYSAEEEREDAKRIDKQYFKAVIDGTVDQSYQRGRPKNAGSSKPEDITAFGAKLPPGGGGGKYSRIVSGSYDESIFIWRRDKEGLWKPQHTLRQEEGSRAVIRNWARVARTIPNTNASWLQKPTLDPQIDESPLGDISNLFPEDQIDKAIAAGAIGLRQTLNEYPDLLHNEYLRRAIDDLKVHTKQLMYSVVIAALQAGGYDTSDMLPLLHRDTTLAEAPDLKNAPVIVNRGMPPNVPHPTRARIFKLQFDARRIICCSQTPTIVGWDFANGDEDIIEASRFFAPLE